MSTPHLPNQPASETLPAGNAETPSNQLRPQQVQAALLEHNSSSTGVPPNDALAGGASPQSPRQAQAKAPGQRHRRKRRDNHVSVRLDDIEDGIVARRMQANGESQSDAVRAIIRESESRAPAILIRPKSPPLELEIALGIHAKWRKEFAAARPRLNIPTPTNDLERHQEVKGWRQETERLLKEIPQNEEVLKTALKALTSLTPESLIKIKTLKRNFRNWASDKRKKEDISMAEKYEAVVDLFNDLGITD